MKNESFYTQRSFDRLAKKLFRFFSEIPFSFPDDPALLQTTPQREFPALDIFLPQKDLFCPPYSHLRSRQLETLEGYFPQAGAWMTSVSRVSRFWGGAPDTHEGDTDLEKLHAFYYDSHWQETGEFNWNKIDQTKILDAKKGRILYYHRVDVNRVQHGIKHYTNFEEFLVKMFTPMIWGEKTFGKNYEYSLSLKLTPEWYTLPKGGVLRIPSPPNVLGTHRVSVVGYMPEGIIVRNSWGMEWGEGAHCVIPFDVVREIVIDAWVDCFPGVFPRLKTTNGLVCLSWKTNAIYPFPEIYCEEIVDVVSGERLAWAFATKNSDGGLEIEEFFVWPEFRKKGYARILANRLLLLGKVTNRHLVMLVPWSDCETHKLSGVIKIAEMLGLPLTQSETPTAGLIGRKKVRDVITLNAQNLSKKNLFLDPDPNEIAATLDIPFRPEGPRDEMLPKLVPIWFATNREPTGTLTGEIRFGGTVSKKVTYGRCDVTIPKWHRFGKIKQSQWEKWLSFFQSGKIDKSIHEINYPLQVIQECQFWSSVNQSFLQSEQNGYQSDGLVFLHGYNNSFDDAAIYAGQLAFDLKIPNTAFFSWPSKGTILAYLKDGETISLCSNAIFDFIVQFSDVCPNGKIHVIAHSMGNRGLLSAFYTKILYEVGRHFQSKKIGQVFLAAPDVNTEEFKTQVAGIVQVSDRVTLYTTKQDLALWASQKLHQYQRAGAAPPFTIVDGVDTIHVPLVDCRGDIIRHSYFARMAPLLYDIDSLIQSNRPPNNRLRLCEKSAEGKTYWEFTQ